MSDTILVIGATGQQGGSVASHLLDRGAFKVRALTRKPASQAAQQLRAHGAEVVAGDLDDRASLRAAMKGVYGVFGVTSFWEHFEKEEEQGRNLINAVAGAEVGHFVFSSLPSVKLRSNGALTAPHLDVKYELEQYTRALDVRASFINAEFYYENFFTFFPPQKNGDGAYHFGFNQGDAPLPTVAAEDVGGVVAAIFEQPEETAGETVRVIGDYAPAARYAEAMSRVSGKTVKYDALPREVVGSFPMRGAEELAATFDFHSQYNAATPADFLRARTLYPGMQTFEQWVSKRADSLAQLLR